MKFFFADSLDYVDPKFDFLNESFHPDRFAQRDDVYPHEFFDFAPYDGLLVSRAIVGDEGTKGKYTTAQAMRFRRDGADKFMRYPLNQGERAIMGDCGAFSYLNLPEPPYSVEDMIDYYGDCHFTHAVSIDHVILGYDESLDTGNLFELAAPDEWLRRYELTLTLAEHFLNRWLKVGALFKPIGVAQGWSPASYAAAVERLVKMGYEYVALGGMVPLKVDQIHRVVDRVRQTAPTVDLHLFGFTKADSIQEFVKYDITSFDSTSPMLRAFKDGRNNYFDGNRWYTAIRVPQADENSKFKRSILAGHKDQRKLRNQEQLALSSLRAFAAKNLELDDTLEALMEYGSEFSEHVPIGAYREVLTDRPWEKCHCRACAEAGVEVIVFRGSNRNRRRGFHNLYTFHNKLQTVRTVNA